MSPSGDEEEVPMRKETLALILSGEDKIVAYAAKKEIPLVGDEYGKGFCYFPFPEEMPGMAVFPERHIMHVHGLGRKAIYKLMESLENHGFCPYVKYM